MLQFDPNDPEELAFALNKAVKKSGLTLAQIASYPLSEKTCLINLYKSCF